MHRTGRMAGPFTLVLRQKPHLPQQRPLLRHVALRDDVPARAVQIEDPIVAAAECGLVRP
jgi:hypothetical protein